MTLRSGVNAGAEGRRIGALHREAEVTVPLWALARSPVNLILEVDLGHGTCETILACLAATFDQMLFQLWCYT